jgi:hypothetical protein
MIPNLVYYQLVILVSLGRVPAPCGEIPQTHPADCQNDKKFS